MADTAVDVMLRSRRAFAVAAAGCGKTELLGQLVADPRSGRQLVLTHTHAGVAAIKKRLADMRVPPNKFHLDTIAGWGLRYGAAYPAISGYLSGAEAKPDWDATYPGAEKVCRSALGKLVLKESFDGVLVDEYQDCSMSQHALVGALADCIACRAVGDPLQTIFGFREDPVVPWTTIQTEFEVMDGTLTTPWRWRREGRNAALGEWLVSARTQLETGGRLVIAEDAPVNWVHHDASGGNLVEHVPEHRSHIERDGRGHPQVAEQIEGAREADGRSLAPCGEVRRPRSSAGCGHARRG